MFSSLDNWQFRTNLIVGSNGVFQFVEPNFASNAQQFYRLNAAPHLPSGLVSWWRGEGNYLDSFGGRNGSNAVNGPTFAPGLQSTALKFSGTNALFLNKPALPPTWTLSLWVKPSEASGGLATLFADEGMNWNLELSGTRLLGVTVTPYGQVPIFGIYVPANEWTHLTVANHGT